MWNIAKLSFAILIVRSLARRYDLLRKSGEKIVFILAKCFPRFFASKLKNPIFIIGCFRSGTTLLTNLLYNTTITDMETGYKVFKKEVIDKLDIKSKDFTVEAEITAKVFKNRFKVYEVPISYYGRTYSEGKKIRWYHGITAIWALIKYKFTD